MAHDSFLVWPSSCEAFLFHSDIENKISDLLFVVWRQVNNSSAWFITRTSVYNKFFFMKFVKFAWTSEWQYGRVQYMTSIYIFDRSWNVDFIGTPNIATNTLLLMFTCHQDDWCLSFILHNQQRTFLRAFTSYPPSGETRQYECLCP